MRKGHFFILSTFTLAYSTALMIALLLPSSSYPSHVIFSVDKLWHIGTYLIFTLALNSTFKEISNEPRYHITWACIVTILHATTSEYFQQFSPGRSSDFTDWFADMIGMGIALILINAILGLRKKTNSK